MSNYIYDDMAFEGLWTANFVDGSYFGEYYARKMVYVDKIGFHTINAYCSKCDEVQELAVLLSDRGLFEYYCECDSVTIQYIYEALT